MFRKNNYDDPDFVGICCAVVVAVAVVAISITILCLTGFLASGSNSTTDLIESTNEPETEEPINLTEVVETTPTEILSEPVEASEMAETEPEIDEYELELLACVIYTEAGGDAVCDDCRRRVADIVLNRVESDLYPDTIYAVLTQPSQYAAFSLYGVYWPSRANDIYETEAVERAYRIAREVLEGNHSDLYGNDYLFQAAFKQGSSGFWHCGIYWGKI